MQDDVASDNYDRRMRLNKRDKLVKLDKFLEWLHDQGYVIAFADQDGALKEKIESDEVLVKSFLN